MTLGAEPTVLSAKNNHKEEEKTGWGVPAKRRRRKWYPYANIDR